MTFLAFFMMPPQVFKLVIDSIVWAFKHTMRNISETGLTILMELFDNISGTEVAAPFYQSYFLTLLQDLFVVLTDAFHKSGFSLQSALLLRMCNEVDSGKVQVPLWDPAKINDPTMTNSRFLREHICQLLAQSYPNLSQAQIMAFVEGLFSLKDLNLFKNHLRDFLVQIKEFAGGEDNAKLYEADKEAEAAKATKEETERNMQIPGMIPPNVDPRNEAESMLD
jgi:exportin-1